MTKILSDLVNLVPKLEDIKNFFNSIGERIGNLAGRMVRWLSACTGAAKKTNEVGGRELTSRDSTHNVTATANPSHNSTHSRLQDIRTSCYRNTVPVFSNLLKAKEAYEIRHDLDEEVASTSTAGQSAMEQPNKIREIFDRAKNQSRFGEFKESMKALRLPSSSADSRLLPIGEELERFLDTVDLSTE